MTYRILLSPPDVGPLETAYVSAAIESGWVAPAGPDLEAFEAEIAARVGRSYGVGVASGTAALHLALLAWGVGPGDVVPVSTLTFVASVNAIHYVGASPYFVDCDPETGNLDPALLDEAITSLRAAGASVPAVIAVDLLGKSVDHTRIAEVLAHHPGVRLLSDAAESLGASHAGRPAASFGDAAILSFNGNKIMTTSGGGMLVCDDRTLADYVRKLSTQAREPVMHYEHVEVGYNYRLSNILAALGRAQLNRLDEMMVRRRGWRERYRALVADVPGVSILGGTHDADDNCWLTTVLIDPAVTERTAGDLVQELERLGVESRPMWKPMHLQPVWKECDGSITGEAERIFRTGVTLPSGSGMSEEDFAVVTQGIRTWLG